MAFFQRTAYRPQRPLSLDSLVFSAVLGTMLVVIVAGTVIEATSTAAPTLSQTPVVTVVAGV